MPQSRRRAGFAQKAKSSGLIIKIFFADDFQGYGAVQIDIECFVSDPHRTPTQLVLHSIHGLGAVAGKFPNSCFTRNRSGWVRPALSNAAKSSRVTSPKFFPFSGLFQYLR
jgi:hypothetical protein